MNKFINTVKTLDPTIRITLGLMFAVGVIVGQQTANKDVKTRYIVDASEVEVIYNNPYKALTLEECVTDWECETAQLIADNRDGKLAHIEDPSFFPDSVPVLEPVYCEVGDAECEEANKNAGKPAH